MKTKSLLLATAALFVGVAACLPSLERSRRAIHMFSIVKTLTADPIWESILVISRPIELAICT